MLPTSYVLDTLQLGFHLLVTRNRHEVVLASGEDVTAIRRPTNAHESSIVAHVEVE